MPSKDITILVDSREQKPWIFDPEIKAKSGYKSRIVGQEVVGLDAADYTIKGYEDSIRIERKASFQELYGNLMPNTSKERFLREMELLRGISYKYIVIESNINQDVWAMCPPQIRYGPPCSKIYRELIDISMEYGINIVTAGNCGCKLVRSIFECFIKNNE